MDPEVAEPVGEHLPTQPPKGHVLVVSDYRLLNLGHAATLCAAGYAVYTAVACTDVHRIFEQFRVPDLDLVAFISLVHGWHHQEDEGRPHGITSDTDPQWQVRNIKHVIDTIHARQQKRPIVLIASDLLRNNWYDITAQNLAAAGVEYHTCSASDPYSLLEFLKR